ncbi:MAG TPA: hypothetical protein VK868_00620 [Pyrinomonadaceae bacterium]|nr:hypothetical protein [Pyrinomonadaceae bacterium]
MSCSCFSSHTNSMTVADPNPAKHVNFNVGMVLGVDDFTQEFAYLSGRDQWLARDLIGYGTVRGLNVRMEVDAIKGPRVVVEPGVALSPRGQLICVPTAQCAYLKDWVADHAEQIAPVVTSPPDSDLQLYVVLCYRNCPTDDVPIAGEPCRSEDKLMAPSRLSDDFVLELRLQRPVQREEDAVRDFVAWLKQVPVSDADPSTPLDQFLQAIRDAASEWLTSPLSSPLTSPPGDFMFGSPPDALIINVADESEYLRAAFRIWVTELRPRWISRWHGCAATHIEGDAQADEHCVLLAQLDVPLLPLSPGTFDIPNEEIPVIQDDRPYIVHLRLLQEWVFSGLAGAAEAAAGGGGGPQDLVLPPVQQSITNVEGPATIDLKEEQIIIANSAAGLVRLNLPPSNEQEGRTFLVKRISTGSLVQIFAGPGDQVEGQGSIQLTAQNRFVQVIANPKLNAWHVIAQ